MRKSIILLFVLVAISPARADDTQPRPSNEVLGFDSSKVQPPDAEKGEPVARLFYDYIYRADVDATSPKLTEDEARRLTGTIFGKLRQRYIDRHKITATPEEIQQFVAAIRRRSPADEDGSESEKEEARRSFEAIGEQMVKGWKLDRALYKKHGGTVIFQQGNPFEPVGAYRKFLEEMEEAKVFEVYDPDNHDKFWHYFVRQHPFQVPTKDIDFDRPWWMSLSVTATAESQIATKGLILDLDADKGVEVEDGNRVVKWTNQVAAFAAKDFVKQDAGRKEPGSGRPALKRPSLPWDTPARSRSW